MNQINESNLNRCLVENKFNGNDSENLKLNTFKTNFLLDSDKLTTIENGGVKSHDELKLLFNDLSKLVKECDDRNIDKLDEGVQRMAQLINQFKSSKHQMHADECHGSKLRQISSLPSNLKDFDTNIGYENEMPSTFMEIDGGKQISSLNDYLLNDSTQQQQQQPNGYLNTNLYQYSNDIQPSTTGTTTTTTVKNLNDLIANDSVEFSYTKQEPQKNPTLPSISKKQQTELN